MPSSTPCWGKEHCEACGRQFWEHYSRLHPQAFTLEEFEERFIVDESAKEIREKNPLPPLSAIDNAILDEFRERFDKLLEDELIHGTATETPTGILGESIIHRTRNR
jgi:hypothetical protein